MVQTLRRELVNITGNLPKGRGYDNLSTICAAATHQASVYLYTCRQADECIPFYYSGSKPTAMKEQTRPRIFRPNMHNQNKTLKTQ
jgi:hypothetical protein